MAKQLNRKPGQLWRLNRYAYPLRPGLYVIRDFARRRFDYASQRETFIPDSAFVLLSPVGEGQHNTGIHSRQRSITRNALTTRRGLWSYMGMDSTEERNRVVRCVRCGGADVIKCRYPDAGYICPDCE